MNNLQLRINNLPISKKKKNSKGKQKKRFRSLLFYPYYKNKWHKNSRGIGIVEATFQKVKQIIKKPDDFIRNKGKSDEFLCNMNPSIWQWILDSILTDEEDISKNIDLLLKRMARIPFTNIWATRKIRDMGDKMSLVIRIKNENWNW